MTNRTRTGIVLLIRAQGPTGCNLMASLLALVAMSLGCDRSPSGPTPPATSTVSTLTVAVISPNQGPTFGTTPVLITGTGFQSGATVTLGGTAVTIIGFTSTAITATTAGHPAGTVDVVVTNPDGQSARLTGGYTYAAVVPPLSIAAVSPNVGSTGGGLGTRISGTGFQPGSIVRFDDTAMTTHFFNSTTLDVAVMAHAAGTVDIVVTNPDGQASRLSGGYTYVLPESLDFNGTWKGEADDARDSHRGVEMGFTIENNTLASVSCGSATLNFSPRPSVSHGEFSFSGADGVAVSGRILTTSVACGKIHLALCAPSWCATKQ